MTVIAADSEKIEEPVIVNEIVMHVGERFDVYVDTNGKFNGETFWIRADTLEPISQGYANGIRAIVRVTDGEWIKPSDVDDPSSPVQTQQHIESETTTLNCRGGGNKNVRCIPITELSPKKGSVEKNTVQSKIHTVDLHQTPAPQYAHFVRVDDSYFIQNELPAVAMTDSSFRGYADAHPHTVTLNLSNTDSNIILFRSTLLMDVPFRIDGHKGMFMLSKVILMFTLTVK
jgi:FtsP/CotA-like multicopper oxidase with cupredoxin domain